MINSFIFQIQIPRKKYWRLICDSDEIKIEQLWAIPLLYVA